MAVENENEELKQYTKKIIEKKNERYLLKGLKIINPDTRKEF